MSAVLNPAAPATAEFLLDLSPPTAALPPQLQALSKSASLVAQAVAVLWTGATLKSATRVLYELGYLYNSSDTYQVSGFLDDLARQGVLTYDTVEGTWAPCDELRWPLYALALSTTPWSKLNQAVSRVADVELPAAHGRLLRPGLLRLALFGPNSPDESNQRWAQLQSLRAEQAEDLLAIALGDRLSMSELARMHPSQRMGATLCVLRRANAMRGSVSDSFVDDLLERAALHNVPAPAELLEPLAELLVHRQRLDDALAVSHHLPDRPAQCIRGAVWVQKGQWTQARDCFQDALAYALQTRSRVLLHSLLPYYLLSQFAQGEPPALLSTRRFLEDQAGSWVQALAHPAYGLWAHALDVKLGRGKAAPHLFELQSSQQRVDPADAWRTLLRAWLGQSALPHATLSSTAPQSLQQLTGVLRARGHSWLAEQVAIADAVWHGDRAPAGFFCKEDPQAWMSVLDVLTQLVPTSSIPALDERSSVVAEHRMLWELVLDAQGAIETIRARHQKKGARGKWNKSQPVSLARVSQLPGALPQDKALAALTVRQATPTPYYAPAEPELDLARAARALVGHPHVVLHTDPQELITLETGEPSLVAEEVDGDLVLRVHPPARQRHPAYRSAQDTQALRAMTVVRDEANERVWRLVHLTPEQLETSQRLARTVRIPTAARAQLDPLLQKLREKFDVRADHLPADQEVAPELMLHAEVANDTAALSLRLRVAPLGDKGPRLAPGEGRVRLVVKDGRTTLGTRRDLSRELELADEVLQALPALESAHQVEDEWHLADAESALAVLAQLQGMKDKVVVDWPRGKPVRVVRAGLGQLGLNVSTGKDWFKLSGAVAFDEGLVLSLKELLATNGTTRYVPMGDNVYAQLTDELLAKVQTLSAVAETDRQGETRVSTMATNWLQESLEGTAAQVDADFEDKVQRLAQMRSFKPRLPRGLKAKLRSYQREAFEWMMRLAHAGFGACLADDMGLGKTVQTIVVLLARAKEGPALVAAPATVIGNWAAELQKFAPSLRVIQYASGATPRDLQALKLGPHDIVVVSYGLLQANADTFVAQKWATSVMDESNAIKNPLAKRTQVAYELDAQFRLALSGTPIENRLSELWSHMRYCNPGLLGSLTRFNERFANPIERNSDQARMDMLRRLVAPFLLRRTKEQVLPELPPLTEVVLRVEPDEAQAMHYEVLRQLAAEKTDAILNEEQNQGQARFQVLQQLSVLRQASCDPRLVTPGQAEGAKLREFRRLARELAEGGHRTLVFSQFLDHLALMKDVLVEEGLSFKYLDGSTAREQRYDLAVEFQQGGADFFLISLGAGNSGLNLTGADYVILADPWWNPTVEDQACGRAHRMGQTRPVTVYRLITKGTLEEGILELQAKKRQLASSLLEGGELGKEPSLDELVALARAA